MSVCLITPPSAFLLDERVFLSLGVLKVAASLEQRGYKVNFLDLSGVENYLSPLVDYISACRDDAVGITATTPQMPAVLQIADAIRKARPNLRIILGGPHVTLVNSAHKIEAKRGTAGRGTRALQSLQRQFDVLVSGDGELAILAALEDRAQGTVIDGDDPKGAFWLNDKGFTESPWPARHLIDASSYNYRIEGKAATSLVAQLGCPFNCGFCGGRNSKSLRVIRNRSTASVLAEVEHLHREYGYTGFMFYDDELNVNRNFVEMLNGLYELQVRLGTSFALRGFVKSELFTAEQAAAMVRAGFKWLLCGFEGANDRILTNIAKRATLADNTRCVETARKAGLKVKALMSVGHPGESEETIMDVRNWLIAQQVDDFDCTVISTYPGTPYYDFAVETSPGIWTYTQPKTGDRLHAYEIDYAVSADYYKGDPKDGYKSFVFTDHLKAEEIVELRNKVESDVRANLRIPFNPGAVALRYEHSMGQGLPAFIHRTAA